MSTCASHPGDVFVIKGQESEISLNYKWEGVNSFDPGKLSFHVRRFDKLLDMKDFLAIVDVIYGGVSGATSD